MYNVIVFEEWSGNLNYYFFNKKENAVNKAKEIYNDYIKKECDGDIKFFEEEYLCEENGYEALMKEIETANHMDDIVEIGIVETED